MLTLSFLAIGAGFPLAALVARRRSAKTLWILTGLMIVAVFGLALSLATHWAGNRLVDSQGYAQTALGIVRLALVLFVFPIVATAATVAVLGNAVDQWFAYPVAVAVTALSLFVGLNAMFWLAYSFR
ncbi:MAG TPA: hypothetical protein VH583_06850 [Vicinamibacterales bacterium]